ncbi:class I SAM-dependent methyltransferase [Cellulomonas xylanilytica]|uniref:Methyltransferase type 11 domain-containing protein n=1 Tax=Cellulomonas xylanilytica TaxID=233583 RepID=A0A510V303_9CELL|nr:class I SAM-dependent methyltransferase [Cellulomonas xylanilytica]GEK21259.1 hypothetical protein CXY01_17790 [Cellulomonas xylanilytica]
MADTDHQHGHRHRRGHGTGPMHDPKGYERLSARLATRLYRRVARDVTDLRLPAGSRVLDVGTGPGTLPRLIAASAPGLQVDAVDVAPEMIAWAQQTETPRVTYTVADVESLPWPDATFDVVVSSLSQHHWGDAAAGLREIRRVLRPGGQAWVYDFGWALAEAGSTTSTLAPTTDVTHERSVLRMWWFFSVGRLVLRAR